MQTAIFLERLVAQRPLPTRLVVASSMSIYGEGEYECPEARAHRTAASPGGATAGAPVGALLPHLRCRAGARRNTREQGADSHFDLRDHQARPRGAVPGGGRCLRDPHGGAALLQRDVAEQALSNPYTGVAAIFASRLLNGQPPVIFEDGEQSRDLTHVSDIVRGSVARWKPRRAAGHAINLGTGRPSTVLQIAAALAAGLQLELEPIRNSQYRAGDIRHCVADPSQARELLGFEATVTLEDGCAGCWSGWPTRRPSIGWRKLPSSSPRVDWRARDGNRRDPPCAAQSLASDAGGRRPGDRHRVAVRLSVASVPTGAATVQILVDSPDSALANLSQETGPLTTRASVFAQVMTSRRCSKTSPPRLACRLRRSPRRAPTAAPGEPLDMVTPSPARAQPADRPDRQVQAHIPCADRRAGGDRLGAGPKRRRRRARSGKHPAGRAALRRHAPAAVRHAGPTPRDDPRARPAAGRRGELELTLDLTVAAFLGVLVIGLLALTRRRERASAQRMSRTRSSRARRRLHELHRRVQLPALAAAGRIPPAVGPVAGAAPAERRR